ncbi:MAG: glycoside hydrolase family 2 protein [Brevundimonas sp.]|uniref:glycoside hydrolase family 2 protein n=1 Tax=Brevundimonas sp. TaxID=1871086 RepID=UPI00256E95E3|nr:glycoside hydrolase family 2 TIM barrel-domain containing protein [Brevundimonas sp.]MDK2747272.1 glycoside hydrolase family 2 protein [Brevundimonas sp.]
MKPISPRALRHRLIIGGAVWALAAGTALSAEETALVEGWRFVREDVQGAQAPRFDDAAWSSVVVPHTYNAADSGIGGAKARGEPEGVYYRGPAWYRLSLDHAPEPGKRYYLHFGGATLKADIFLNGRAIGTHEGGYAAFRYDVTDALRAGRNLLAVRVDNARNTRYAPLNGDFNIFGGLYREVKLIEAPDLHIDLLDHAGPGLHVRTASLADGQADIAARVLVKNDRRSSAQFEVVTRIIDADGATVAESRTPTTLEAGRGQAVEQTLRLAEPKLWEGRRSPYLYQVKTEILVDGQPIDSAQALLGVRTVGLNAQGQFTLNGQPYALYGANIQMPTRFGKGPIVTDAEIDEDMKIMADMGVTALRLAHMQHPPRVYEEADRLGILLTTEVPLIDDMDPSDDFRENLVQQMRELIAQTDNHPSVGLWGIGNELRTSGDAANRLLAALQSTAKELDPGRPTTYAHCCLDDDDSIAQHSDTVSYNRYFGWYWTEAKDIGPWADELHARMPNRPIGVSEYGAGASILHQEDPVMRRPVADGYWHPEQWQTSFHEVHWRELGARQYLWSNFIWLGFDFPSFKRNEGDRPAINDKGLVTEDRRTFKDAYYWYQANWSDVPMLHITSRRDVNKRIARVKVKVFSNQPQVRLRLNGGDWATVPVVDHAAVWDIDLASGVNVVDAVTEVDGRELTDSVRWTYRTNP